MQEPRLSCLMEDGWFCRQEVTNAGRWPPKKNETAASEHSPKGAPSQEEPDHHGFPRMCSLSLRALSPFCLARQACPAIPAINLVRCLARRTRPNVPGHLRQYPRSVPRVLVQFCVDASFGNVLSSKVLLQWGWSLAGLTYSTRMNKQGTISVPT